MCGGIVHMKRVMNIYISNSKVREDSHEFLDLLISTNLSFMKKKLSSFIKLGTIQTSNVLLYNYSTNTKRKFKQHGVWNVSSHNIDGLWDGHFEIFTYMGIDFGDKEEEEQ